eukprot:SAG25_NODE_455_length_7865_cov_2.578032_11_plen_150_part_00
MDGDGDRRPHRCERGRPHPQSALQPLQAASRIRYTLFSDTAPLLFLSPYPVQKMATDVSLPPFVPHLCNPIIIASRPSLTAVHSRGVKSQDKMMAALAKMTATLEVIVQNTQKGGLKKKSKDKADDGGAEDGGASKKGSFLSCGYNYVP